MMFHHAANPKKPQKGEWVLVTGKDFRSVMLSCPVCGGLAALDHDVDTVWWVTTGVQCARDGCPFHERIALEDWDHGALHPLSEKG